MHDVTGGIRQHIPNVIINGTCISSITLSNHHLQLRQCLSIVVYLNIISIGQRFLPAYMYVTSLQLA